MEEVQRTLAESMMSMQNQFEKERSEFNKKIEELEKKIKKKDLEIEDLKESILSKNNQDTLSHKIIAELNQKLREKENEIISKTEQIQNNSKQIFNLNNQLQEKQQKLMESELEKKKMKEEHEKKYSLSISQGFLYQKNSERYLEENQKKDKFLEEKNKRILELEQKLEELSEKFQEAEKNNKNFLSLLKELKGKEEKLKKVEEEFEKEREKLKIEKEKFKQEMMKKEIEIKKIDEEKERMKEKEDQKNNLSEQNANKSQNKSINIEGQDKLILDILCEFLLKLNNSQYFISIFDLLDKSLKQYDELKFFNKLSSYTNEEMNDIIFNFFDSVKSYFSIAKEKATLTDFLSQKSFKISNIDKEDIEIIKKINTIKIGDSNLLDIYLKKKELFFKSKEFIFNLLKEKISIDQENEAIRKNYGKKKSNKEEDKNEFLNITPTTSELTVNFDELIKQDFGLVKFQVVNVFSKIKELNLSISKFPLFLFYSLIVNCQNLISLKIVFKKDESEEKNKKDIEILNEIVPKLIGYLKQLKTFSLIGLPLSQIQLPNLSSSLKHSKINKLSLINCFKSGDDLIQLIPYFSIPNTLTDIDLSNHNFPPPAQLGSSLLNYNVSKNLISINFNNCKLKEDDIKTITNYIVLSTNILSCDIGKNILTPLGCSTLGYLTLKATSLQTLKVNECGINGESLLFLFNGKGSKVLKNINLNGNDIGDIGLVSLSAFMKSSPNLESVELEKCGGADMGFSSLVNTINGNNNTKMKYINYHKNNVTKASMDLLKKNDEFFTKKVVTFALDKIEGFEDKINCVTFV